MLPIRAIAAAIFLWALSLAASPEPPIIPAKTPAELEQRLLKIMKDHKVPGMGLVITTRQGSSFEKGLGLADVAANKPASADTLFRIGSISKTFVGLAALKLVEEGRLDLNAPVHALVPEVVFRNAWEASDPVRVVHLLEHTTGWEDLHFREYAHNDPTPATLAQGLAVGPESRTSRWRPGTRFAYCNSGPAVAAAIIEKITGRKFEDYVQDTFFTPIGMPTADYFLSSRSKRLLTNLYHSDGRTPYPYWHIVMRPAGAINASAHEMGAYLRFFLNRGEAGGLRLLTEASLQRMETPTTPLSARGGLKTGYGLHNYTSQDDRGFVWHGHNGGVEGGLSELNYLPESGVGYFFSINAGEGEAYEAIHKEVRAFATRDLPTPVLPPTVPVPESVAREYRGWYRAVSPRNGFDAFLDHLNFAHVSFKADQMIIRPWIGPSDVFLSLDGTRFRREKQSAAKMVLMTTPEGRFVADSGLTFARISAWRAWTEIVVLYLFLATLATVPLFALVWGFRWIFRRMRGVPNLQVRVWPLVTELVLFATIGIFMLIGDDAIMILGHRTGWSMAITACTWIFAASSAMGLWSALRAKRQGMNRWAYFHSLGAAIVFAIVTLYLASWGVIGFRSWA